MSALDAARSQVIAGLRSGRPVQGPLEVHLDVTNACNAACITCWDHSPLLKTPRPKSWKGQRLSWEHFEAILASLDRFGSVRHVVLSGMGEPLTHPRIYDMIAEVKARGWSLTVLSNLLAADIERLATSGVDHLLVGVHGASAETYAKFHPGWDDTHFFRMVAHLRRLALAGVRVRHVQVINRDTAEEIVAMVRFGKMLSADRVNYKLASLAEGTEAVAVAPEQVERMLRVDVPEARKLAAELGVRTNLDLFERQLRAGDGEPLVTTPMAEVGCAMGYVYTRVAVDGTVLYCCNTAVRVGHLDDGPLDTLWWGPAWQALRERIARHEYFPGCERCGKFEQNVAWADRLRSA